ncbi:molybdenum cofactor guanylyltransferase [Rossellomorea oryzaecorticis]|uniref:Probable molybdenum cofactor guanylyltransferase n=1 Tax=Rossellomorea oryzaecorticis TaxID=1396505 RepID=A0ABU9K9J3_9BACI
MSLKNVMGVILAGGKSRRFGSNKGFALYKGIPFYEWSIRAMKKAVESCVLVTSRELESEYKAIAGMPVIVDDSSFKESGPLGGVYTAMSEMAPAEWYVLLPIDVPYINSSIIEQIIEVDGKGFKAIIPIIEGKKQFLIAAYHYSLKDMIYEQLRSGNYRMQSLVESIDVLYIKEKEMGKNANVSFRNVNTVQDLGMFESEDCDKHHNEH